SGPSTSSGVLVRGIRDGDLASVRGIASNLKLGSLEHFGDAHGVAIGTRLAESLGVTIGGNITLVSPRGNVTPLGVTPRIKSYPVVAIFEIGMFEYDSTFVFLPFEEAQIYFNLDDEASAIEVYLANADTIEVLRPEIEKAANRQILTSDCHARNTTFLSTIEVKR